MNNNLSAQVYMKTHNINGKFIITLCDKELFENMNMRNKLKLNTNYFGGEIVDVDFALDNIKIGDFVTLVGPTVVKQALRRGLIKKRAIIHIAKNIEYAEVYNL
ncbi:hypothetical protein B9Q13_02555 [Candidatus Marsarchaeota G2 archaeon ECH_B_SAG-G16]|jgi:hypothetical protein|uniref:DUF424 domain-containing protein n=6 Tax=Candidatus Marsarchaeota TaxID=1978152 RepID=A0A2R6C2U0_9ARCH|nr:MAG: hypothetical protein B9P99_03155 [Candidatus Marsarchaeota G1 archaeon OSP_B]PSO02758.1 MAG: hypothetical protein B9Q10_00975 [Candidatus Marsarchaeota G2 archaeon ECH_B_SAG-E12]PSO05210.1 MAG: hypothetical protein B9Q13_02555 [Candidatus Marsarchaeota G2 archaeon ECH_B_SAG-G16]